MARDSIDERLERLAKEGQERYHEMRAADPDLATRPCTVGDLFVFSASASYGVEWLVLARDPAQLDRVLVVPADAHLSVGSRDLRMARQAHDGSLVARLSYGRWIDQQHCQPSQRAGAIVSSEVFRLRRRWLELGDQEWNSSLVGREVDEDPEYQDWIDEQVAPAWRSLAQLESVKRIGEPPPELDPAYSPARFRWLKVAAALLMMTALGWWLSDLLRDKKPVETAAIMSPVVKLVQPRSETRGRLEVEIPKGSTHLLLGLEKSEASGFEGVEIELVSKNGSRVMVKSPDRWPADGGVLRIPVEQLRNDSYTVVLTVRRDGVAEVLQEYDFGVRLEE